MQAMKIFNVLPLVLMLIYVANSDSFHIRNLIQNIQTNSITNKAIKTGDFNQFSSSSTKQKTSRHSFLSLNGGFRVAELSQLTTTTVDTLKSQLLSNPSNLFNSLLVVLLSFTACFKVIEKLGQINASKRLSATSGNSLDETSTKPVEVANLQLRFLTVFWLLRMADWLQGPYFYEVYSSKIINGIAVTPDLVSKLFLVGFASTGLLGPWIGSFVDSFGRKAGTLAFAAFYTLGALSTASSNLFILLLGRFFSGIGTSLLHSAPEAWLVGEHQKSKFEGKWLGQTFGWAYAGDSLVAITAGQLAAVAAATSYGASGPFLLSLFFLASGGALAAWKWKENVAPKQINKEIVSDSNMTKEEKSSNTVSVGDALSVMMKDKRIMLVGAVQALFEGAMYIFVLQWPPAIKTAILEAKWLGTGDVPYGTVFSCFMAACLLGSTIFSKIQNKVQSKVELPASLMMISAAVAMTSASVFGLSSLSILAAAFFIFEACVGMYFPSIGTLRSKYIPDSHRSVIMNLFGVPLNLIVISVFLSIKQLGVQGALGCAAVALSVASVCMTALFFQAKADDAKSNTTK